MSIPSFFGLSSLSASTGADTTQSSIVNEVWQNIRRAAQERQASGSTSLPLIRRVILDQSSLTSALSVALTHQETDIYVSSKTLRTLLAYVYHQAPALIEDAAHDLRAVSQRDPAAKDLLTPFLYFKGFHALQTHRAAHWLWQNGRKDDALFLQNRSSLLYAVDIHPAARIGKGIMIDHATGLVIGETSVVEDNVSMLHNVTLGGTGKEQGDRHPKIRSGVMIGAGAKILGNIEVGEGACIAAGTVVLEPVEAHTTVAGIPARVIGKPKSEAPAQEMDQNVFSNAPATAIV